MDIFSKEMLMLNVLNSLAERAALKSSDLVLLNFDFSANEIRALMDVLAEKQVKRQPLSKHDLVKRVLTIKPDIEGVETFCSELKVAFDAEERFPDILND